MVMKEQKVKVEVSERCAEVLKHFEDMESRFIAVETIADSFSCLSRMLEEGRTELATACYADQILRTMHCISAYYDLIKDISYDPNDSARFRYEYKDNQTEE